jgi:hypothetical protein
MKLNYDRETDSLSIEVNAWPRVNWHEVQNGVVIDLDDRDVCRSQHAVPPGAETRYTRRPPAAALGKSSGGCYECEASLRRPDRRTRRLKAAATIAKHQRKGLFLGSRGSLGIDNPCRIVNRAAA